MNAVTLTPDELLAADIPSLRAQRPRDAARGDVLDLEWRDSGGVALVSSSSPVARFGFELPEAGLPDLIGAKTRIDVSPVALTFSLRLALATTDHTAKMPIDSRDNTLSPLNRPMIAADALRHDNNIDRWQPIGALTTVGSLPSPGRPESDMTDSNPHPVAAIVRKLTRRTDLGQADIDVLLALPCRLATVNVGGYLTREGDRPDGCVALLSGFAYLSKIAGDGARQILGVHLQGDLIGLQAALLHRSDHSVQALTPAEVAYIPHQPILEAAYAHPAIARALWRETVVDASVSREWLLNVGQRDARRRISHLLCELALRQEAAGTCQAPHYTWPMTQEQVGDATGLTSVHVNRTLQGLRADSLIRLSRQNLTIIDWPRLRAAGDFNQSYLHQPAQAQPVAQRMSA